MLINTVILMLRDALPVILALSFMVLAFSINKRVLRPMLMLSVVCTALLVLLRNDISDSFDGGGYEWLTISALVIAYLLACLSVNQPQPDTFLIVIGCLIISLHLADFTLYLIAFGSYSDRLPAIAIGSMLGAGISISIAVLLIVLLSPYRANKAMKVVWMIFLAAQTCNGIPLLQQIGILNESAPLWDSSPWIRDAGEYGLLLNALMGYESKPDLPYALTWSILVFIAVWSVFRPLTILPQRLADGASS